jgi:hypothetical protein
MLLFSFLFDTAFNSKPVEGGCQGSELDDTKADRFEIRPFFYSEILCVIINLYPIAI